MGNILQFTNDEFSNELLDRFIFATEGRKSKLFASEIPMTREKLAEHLGISQKAIYRLEKSGQIKGHVFKGLSITFYFLSEINETLKKS